MTWAEYAYDAIPPHELERANLWGTLDQEELHCTDLDEAIEEEFDRRFGDLNEFETRDAVDRWLEGQERFGAWEPMSLKGARQLDAESILERLIEDLDEEYGSPEGDEQRPEALAAMRAAADVFVAVVAKHYRPWTCETIFTVTVPVRAWIDTHAPHWLTEAGITQVDGS